ncbi:putative receptor-like protein kinase At5g38990 [Bidens hawaiensis]|uniref:putative receptor-like protein kinase At5g38990 n=1 Tax=Bidens hawaiensis TaxID=980011 RepID=UPI00404A0F79
MLPPLGPEALCHQFSLSDIKTATNNFSSNLIIGKGSFGNVYRAKTASGTFVAVKRKDYESKQGRNEFQTELRLLSAFRHAHLISLIGYCDDQDANEVIIVYEHMANGMLADHIYKKTGGLSVLSWERRLKICIGVGRGLEYLHTGTGINQIIIHRDIKSSNILLDENLEPRISDFGLCKRCIGMQPDTPIIASAKGTRGYMDPHYYKTRELSTKTDVYAFGVVLLEVFCGRRSSDFVVQGRPKRFVPWARQCIRERASHRIMDRGLSGKIANDGLLIFEDIVLQCLQERPDKRPIMEAVVARLEDALKSQYATYSSSPDEGDEFIRIYFGQVDKSSSYSNSDADSLRYPCIQHPTIFPF